MLANSVRRHGRGFGFSLVAVALTGLPRVSEACSVCMGGREDENRLAFILTTAFLTFLPLLMIGTLVWLFARRALAREQQDAEDLAALSSLQQPSTAQIANSTR
jgi:hypothetical protein